MRNSEVIQLTEVVNDILQNEKVDSDQLLMLQKYAKMGVEESGKTGYRLIGILAAELERTRSGLAKLVAEAPLETVQAAAAKADAENAAKEAEEKSGDGLRQGEPTRTITEHSEPDGDDGGWEEHAGNEQAAMAW